jgi:hypothetical protein
MKKTKKLSVRRQLKSIYIIPLILAVIALGIGIKLISHAATNPVAFEAESGALTAGARNVANSVASGQSAVKFDLVSTTPNPTATPIAGNGACGITTIAPARYNHIIWIWDENHDATTVNGTSVSPYITSMAAKCAKATNVLDNSLTVALPSEPNYAAGTSGSNCNSGITTLTGNGTGCISGDGDHSSYALDTQSIFGLAKANGMTWKSYQESMPTNCALVSSGRYAYKHNPAAFYNPISTDCGRNDVTMPVISCSTTAGAGCMTTPSGSFVADLSSGNLANFTFITPNLDNDMHDGSVSQGDNWLSKYIPLILAGPNYKSGDTAIFIMWDEGSSNSGSAQPLPSVIIAPSIKPGTIATATTNNIGLLKTTQDAMGLKPYLGCASGTPPGGGSNCSANSTVSLMAQLNL